MRAPASLESLTPRADLFEEPRRGIALFGSCWFVVDTMTDDVAAAPGVTGGVTTMIGIEGIPWPITVDRALEASVEVSARPVLKLTAAYPVSICTS